jgi:signal-induced proliferation-associated 1 like protein 3
LEEHLHTKHPATNKGLVHKEIFSYLFPDLDLGCLRLADSKIEDELAKLDESSLIKRHKIGVLLCKAGQSTEEHMYSNKDSTPLFDEFLDLLGGRVALKG